MLAHRSSGFMQGGSASGAGSVSGEAGSVSSGGSDVALIAERETRMSSDELDAHMDRLKRDPRLWERVVSSPDAMGGELAAVANGALEAGGRENLLLAVRAVRHENMSPDARRYVATHPDLWDEALSNPEFYGWSDEDVRDVFEVSRELGLSDDEKRQRVRGGSMTVTALGASLVRLPMIARSSCIVCRWAVIIGCVVLCGMSPRLSVRLRERVICRIVS